MTEAYKKIALEGTACLGNARKVVKALRKEYPGQRFDILVTARSGPRGIGMYYQIATIGTNRR